MATRRTRKPTVAGLKRELADVSRLADDAHRQAIEAEGNAKRAYETLERDRAGRDAEAVAIDACVKALDECKNRVTSRGNYTPVSYTPVTFIAPGTRSSVGRVLAYLHDRYGEPNASTDDLTQRQRIAELERENGELRRQLEGARNVLGFA